MSFDTGDNPPKTKTARKEAFKELQKIFPKVRTLKKWTDIHGTYASLINTGTMKSVFVARGTHPYLGKYVSINRNVVLEAYKKDYIIIFGYCAGDYPILYTITPSQIFENETVLNMRFEDMYINFHKNLLKRFSYEMKPK